MGEVLIRTGFFSIRDLCRTRYRSFSVVPFLLSYLLCCTLTIMYLFFHTCSVVAPLLLYLFCCAFSNGIPFLLYLFVIVPFLLCLFCYRTILLYLFSYVPFLSYLFCCTFSVIVPFLLMYLFCCQTDLRHPFLIKLNLIYILKPTYLNHISSLVHVNHITATRFSTTLRWHLGWCKHMVQYQRYGGL